MKILKMSCFLVALLLVASCNKKATKAGYKLVWQENFRDSTKLDENWSKIPRGKSDWNNYMSNYNGLYEVSNGVIILRGIKNTVDPNDDAPYITGGIYTKDKRVFGHGRIEIRAKLFGAQSAWPAFWMLPKNAKYPNGGEIDIMERLNMDDFVYQTVHSFYTLNHGIKDNPKSNTTAPIDPNDYNVYAVELFADSLSFFVNDMHTLTYPRIDTDKSDQFPFGNKKYFLLLDMQLGGDWVGPVNEQDLPAKMDIDWVRYFIKEE